MIVRETTFADLLAFSAQVDEWRPYMAEVEQQWRGGLSWSAFLGERILAIFGLYERPSKALEAWFAASPEAARHMVALVRQMRIKLRTERSRHVLTLCTIRSGHAPGERLGRLLGFEPTGELVKAPGPVFEFQFWRYWP